MSYHHSRGFGDAASTSRTVGTVGSLTASGVTAALGAGLFGSSVFGVAATSLVPIVGPILGAAVMGIQALIQQSGCGPTCVITSQWANQAAAQLDQLTTTYFSLPSPRTDSQKAAALGAFDAIWQRLQQLCSQPGTGNAGVRCITDRQAGACTWRQKYQPAIPGQPAIGECWNWFNGYRDVISKDPTVPDPAASSTSGVIDSISSIFSPSAGTPSLLPLLGLALAGALLWEAFS